jgi:hypothetical protein
VWGHKKSAESRNLDIAGCAGNEKRMGMGMRLERRGVPSTASYQRVEHRAMVRWDKKVDLIDVGRHSEDSARVGGHRACEVVSWNFSPMLERSCLVDAYDACQDRTGERRSNMFWFSSDLEDLAAD